MPIELSHIGEDLIAEILRTLAEQQKLHKVICAISGRSLIDDLRDFELGEILTFRAEEASLAVHVGCNVYACDGEQRVDVLCTGNRRAIAFEAKLGETRMTPAEFRKRFCTPCEISNHADSRLRGNMIAVLERSLPFGDTSILIAETEANQSTLAVPWWLVVRQVIANRWQRSNDLPVNHARILSFDMLAKVYGSRPKFDQMVNRVIGENFASRWRIPLNES